MQTNLMFAYSNQKAMWKNEANQNDQSEIIVREANTKMRNNEGGVGWNISKSCC
jgi:hypothetical protein